MRFDYRIDKITNWTTLQADLNTLGAKGWELINIFLKGSDYYAILKRERS